VVEPTPEEKRARLLGQVWSSYEEENNFSLEYSPQGGTGAVHVGVKVYLEFVPFTPDMVKEDPYAEYYKTHQPPAQKDCEWDDDQRKKFRRDLVKSVKAGWGRKHTLACAEPGLQDITATLDVDVSTTNDPGEAQLKVIAQKTPPSTPRFASH